MKTKQEKLKEIIEKCKCVIPYVQATINTNITIDRDWIQVHRGRAYSSINQLNSLLKSIEDLDKDK